MATLEPVDKQVDVVLYPAEYDPQALTWGYSQDWMFVDPRRLQDLPSTPPRSWQMPWTLDDLEYVDALNAVSLRSIRYRTDMETTWEPFDLTTYLPKTGYFPVNAAETWKIIKPSAWRGVSAAVSTAPAATEAALISTARYFENPHFLMTWKMLSPPESYNEPQLIEILLGLEDYGSGIQWRIGIPRPYRPDDGEEEGDYEWSKSCYLIKYDSAGVGTMVDEFAHTSSQRGRGKSTGEEWEAFSLQCFDNKFVMTIAGVDKQWVYGDADAEIRAGYIAIAAKGGQATFLWEDLLYKPAGNAETAEMPYATYLTMAGDAKAKSWIYKMVEVPGDPPVEQGTVTPFYLLTGGDNAKLKVELTSAVTRQSPLLYAVQEIHETVLGTGAGVSANISRDIESIDISWKLTRRGTSGTIVLRNWRGNATGTGYDVGLYDSLTGIQKVAIRARHLFSPDEPSGTEGAWIDLFVGYLREEPRKRDSDLGRNVIELELMDRTLLWQDNVACMLYMPSFGGWDFKEATTHILTRWEVDSTDIEYPADYAIMPIALPNNHPSRGAFAYDSDVCIIDALDEMCRAVGYRWHISPADKIVFERLQYVGLAAVDFTLDETTVTQFDQIEMVDSSRSFEDARNRVFVTGVDEDGKPLGAHYVYQPSIDDDTSEYYVGRNRWLVKEYDEHDKPGMTAQAMLYGNIVTGGQLIWRAPARDLWPADIVDIQVDHLGFAAGTKFRIVTKTTRLADIAAGGDPVWVDEYGAELIAPWET